MLPVGADGSNSRILLEPAGWDELKTIRNLPDDRETVLLVCPVEPEQLVISMLPAVTDGDPRAGLLKTGATFADVFFTKSPNNQPSDVSGELLGIESNEREIQ